MADNIVLNSGSGGSTLKTDDDGTAHWPYSKLAFGADDTQNIVTSTTVNPLPVELPTTQAIATVTTVTTCATVTNLAQFGGVAISLNTGVRDTGTLRVTIATDDVVPISSADIATLAGAVSGTEMQVDIVSDQPIDNTADTITATADTAAVSNDGTLLTPKFAAISGASSGDNTVIAAVVGKKIRVLSYVLIAVTAVDVRFEDGAAGTALSGVMSIGATGGIAAPYSPVGHFETTANTLLNMELSAAVQVSGHVTYVEV